MSWKDTIKPAGTSTWKDTIKKVEPEETARLEAAGRGALQGATLGFSDEIYGAYKGAEAALKGQDYSQAYKEARDSERQKFKELRKKHPYLFTGAELAAGLVVPGGAALKGAKGIKEAAKATAKLGAVEGTAAGAGYSEEDTAADVARDALIGGAIGTATGGILGGAIAGAPKAMKALKKGTSKPQPEAEDLIPRDRIDRALDQFEADKDMYDQQFTLLNEGKGLDNMLDEPELRDKTIRFMQYITDPAAEVRLRSKDSPVKMDNVEGLKKAFMKKIQEGQVSKEVWDEFNLGRELREVLDADEAALRAHYVGDLDGADDELAEMGKDAIVNYELKDPLKGLKRYILDANVAARQIDDATGLDIELIQNQLYADMNKKKGFDRMMAQFHDEARSLREKDNLSGADVIRMIESGSSNPVARKYAETFDKLREESNKLGLQIEKRQNYVPMKRKSGVQLVIALERKGKELLNRLDPDVKLKDVLGDLGEDTGDDILKEVSKIKGERRDLAFLKNTVERMYNNKIRTVQELKDAVGALRDRDSVARAYDPEINATFERGIELPEWLRETNIDKLVWDNTNQASTAGFILPRAKALDSRIYALEKLGLQNSANWLKNYRLDVSGINRPRPITGDGYSKLKDQLRFWGEDTDSDTIRYLPDFLDTMASSIYPNFLGASPKAVIRNFSQPTLMSLAEAGFKDGAGAFYRAHKKVAGNIKKYGWKKYKQMLIDEGSLPESTSAADFEGVRSGIGEYTRSNKIRTTQKAIDKYSDFVMKGFTMSDEFNRMITKELAEEFALGFMKGEHKISKKMPTAIQRRLERVKSSDLPPETKISKVNKIMRDWYLVQTQLAYGKVGGHELGRTLGPGLTMLAKWPVAITSDILDKTKKKEFGRLAAKYLGPAVGASLLQQATFGPTSQMSDRQKQMIGTGGLPAMIPVTSALGFADIFVPVNVQTPLQMGSNAFNHVIKELEGSATDRDRERIQRRARTFAEQYTPVLGSMSRIHEQVYKGLIKGETPYRD